MAREIDTNNVVDTSWIHQSFMMKPDQMTNADYFYRTLTAATYDFADTTIGGNEAINPPPQFTRYADIKVGYGKKKNQDGSPAFGFNGHLSWGMGRYYHEAINQNAVHAYMRFGVPMFNSLTTFFTNFYNTEASSMARTGRGSGLFFTAGKAIGFVVGIVPRAIIFMSNVGRWFMNQQPSKYYYLKPAMLPYWNAVTTIVNTIAVNVGIIGPLAGSVSSDHINDLGEGGPDPQAKGITQEALNTAMHNMEDSLFTPEGGIDVYAMATRFQRNRLQRDRDLQALLEKLPDASPDKAYEELRKVLTAHWNISPTVMSPKNATLTMYAVAYDALEQSKWSGEASSPVAPATPAEGTQAADTSASASPVGLGESIFGPGGTDSGAIQKDVGGSTTPAFMGKGFEKMWEYMKAEFEDGGAYVSFRVDGSGTIGESFSSSTKPPSIQNTINSMSSSARDTFFNLEGGNVVSGGIAGAVQSAIGAVAKFAEGLATGVGLGGLAALAGAAFVDMPEMWDASTANLPRADFTMQLRSPYGNKMSRLINLYIPLAMILAGGLPLATGKQSHTSPFLCEIYVRGRLTCRLGIIDSIQITRGVGNVGWDSDGAPLGIDVSFSVKDLSNVLYMPISAGYTTLQAAATEGTSILSGGSTTAQAVVQGLFSNTWDDDNAYTDYLAVLGNLSLVDQVLKSRTSRLRIAKQIAQFKSFKSPGHMSMVATQSLIGRMITAIHPGGTALGQDGA